MQNYLIDFETYYDQIVSIKTLGTYAYLRHPDCEIYMVAIVGPDVDYVGPPQDAPWDKINGGRWLAHNYAFDGAVLERLRELKKIPREVQPADWNCTANLSVFLGAPRDLAGAARQLLDIEVSKNMRTWMKGRSWHDAVREGRAEMMRDYCRADSLTARVIWEKHSHLWPEHEQWLSRHTIMMGNRGVHTDLPKLEDSIEKLQNVKWEAQRGMPFYKPGAKGLSLVAFRKCCIDAGIEPPETTNKNDPRTAEWENKYLDIPWVRHMRDWRRSNTAMSKLIKMRDRTREDGTCPFSNKYFGGHTGRWSGDGGFNMQNHNRDALRYAAGVGFVEEGGDWEIDVRSHIIAAPGRQLGIVDESQIEPRVLAWLCKDWDFLNLVKTMSPYEAHARLFMGWKGGSLKKENPKLYSLAKARVLALGYGAGWEKFIAMCVTYGVKPEEVLSEPVTNMQREAFLTALARRDAGEKQDQFYSFNDLQQRIWVNSWLQVLDFREKNWRITDFWKTLEAKFKLSLKDGEYELELPSGRSLHYFDIQTLEGKWKARTEKGGDFYHFYGGKLCENATQAIARDVFSEGIERLEKMGFPVLFHVHDEVITDINEEAELIAAIGCMSETPDWLPGCPIAAEGHMSTFYKK